MPFCNKVINTILLFLAIFAISASNSSLFAEQQKIIAQVGNVKITVYELAREKQKLLPFNANYHGGISQEKLAAIEKDALEKLIIQAYKVNHALDNNIKVDDSIIETQFQSIKKRYNTDKDFKNALAGESIKELKYSLQKQELANAAEKLEIDDKININDVDLQKFYTQNKESYLRPVQFKASHILIKVDPSANNDEKTALHKKAIDLANRAKAGEDFYNLAYYNSDDRTKFVGGDLGYFHEGQIIKELDTVIVQMKKNEISEPVRSLYGWHVIKLVDKREKQQLSFEEVKNKISEKLKGDAKAALYASWLSNLKSKYQLK